MRPSQGQGACAPAAGLTPRRTKGSGAPASRDSRSGGSAGLVAGLDVRDDPAVSLDPALAGGVLAHAGESLVPLVGRGRPRQGPEGDRVDDHMLAVVLQAPESRLTYHLGQVAVAFDG